MPSDLVCGECGETIGQIDISIPVSAIIMCAECVTGQEDEAEDK